ncbi:MAG: hypothetical protein HY244_13980 [Rhizobiales bacterium]|nr:hypothetical protein [Hyphomicrobiales bacterium]
MDHFAMGATVGIYLALTILVGNLRRVFEMIENSTAPRMTMALFVGVIATTIAVFASITGVIFTAIEQGSSDE